MHGAGIYRQRYGTDTGLSLSRAAEVQPLVDAFVEEQESSHPERAAAVGVDDELRWADYHRLQWLDRFSLVFCLRDWDRGDAPGFELGAFRFDAARPMAGTGCAVSVRRARPPGSRCSAGVCRSAPGRRTSSGTSSSRPNPLLVEIELTA